MTLLLLDGNSIMNRAFFGIRQLSTHDGRATNAIYGFMNILFSLEENFKPDAVAAAFDLAAPTFRHKMYPEYKAGRHAMPDELKEQMPEIKAILRAMGHRVVELEGWEADDIIGTIAKACRPGDKCYIATGDRDSLQLVDENVTVLLAAPKAGRTETVVYDPARILEDKGVAPPSRLIEVKGLMGDSSDNIPGVQGIGEKTATDLIARYGTIDYIYDNFDSIEAKPAVIKKLEAGRESAFLSRKLGTIALDVPVDTDYSAYLASGADDQTLKSILLSLELNKFIDKLGLRDVIVEDPAADGRTVTVQKADIPVSEAAAAVRAEGALYVLFDDDHRNAALSLDCGVMKAGYEDIAGLLADESVKKYTCDCKSLYSFAAERGAAVRNVAFDTLLAAYLLNPNSTDYSVPAVADTYHVAADLDTDDRLLHDAALLRPLVGKLNDKLIENGELGLLTDVEIPLSEALSSMEREGFAVDKEGIYSFGEMLDGRIAALTSSIYERAGEEFNINSPKQLGTILFEKLGLPAKKKTKSGYSTNADVLEKLKDYDPVINDILEYRTYTKLKSTYCDGLLAAVGLDGRIHSTFRQTETRTGRLSSTEPNLQNIPVRSELGREMRKFFKAADGCVLVDADYSQIELRVLSVVADDKNMQAAFNEGVDVHAVTASQVFGLPLDMVTPVMRSRAKAVNFGIVYGIGAFSLSRDIGVTVGEAKRYIDNYLAHYSGVDAYMKNVISTAKQQGYVTTLFNRRRYLPELSSSNAIQRAFGERVARNMPIQGTAADIIKIAMVKVFARLRSEELRSKLIMQVHDELIIEAPEDEAERVLVMLKEEMEHAVDFPVTLSVDAHIGKTWYDAK